MVGYKVWNIRWLYLDKRGEYGTLSRYFVLVLIGVVFYQFNLYLQPMVSIEIKYWWTGDDSTIKLAASGHHGRNGNPYVRLSVYRLLFRVLYYGLLYPPFSEVADWKWGGAWTVVDMLDSASLVMEYARIANVDTCHTAYSEFLVAICVSRCDCVAGYLVLVGDGSQVFECCM